MYHYGIKGKMWQVLKNIYKKVESCILLGDTRTDFFNIEVGVRQGCILSPLLFLLFINDLCQVINDLNMGVSVGNKRISLLLFADDIVILEDKKDLEYMLRIVHEYSLKWRFKFNYNKCAVLVFSNNKVKRDNITYGNCKNTCNCRFHFRFG